MWKELEKISDVSGSAECASLMLIIAIAFNCSSFQLTAITGDSGVMPCINMLSRYNTFLLLT